MSYTAANVMSYDNDSSPTNFVDRVAHHVTSSVHIAPRHVIIASAHEYDDYVSAYMSYARCDGGSVTHSIRADIASIRNPDLPQPVKIHLQGYKMSVEVVDGEIVLSLTPTAS